MGTLVVFSHHKSQYYSKSKSQGNAHFGSSSPSKDLRAINCRSFQTGSGILPSPLKSCTSPKTPLTPSNTDNKKTPCKITPCTSTPIPINHKACEKERSFSDGSLLLSELWAGPAYSNSPPPSSLPIPKFSVRPKRTVSLELPGSCPEIEMHPFAYSAPASPRREHSPTARHHFDDADSATRTLCRILNLNLDDE